MQQGTSSLSSSDKTTSFLLFFGTRPNRVVDNDSCCSADGPTIEPELSAGEFTKAGLLFAILRGFGRSNWVVWPVVDESTTMRGRLLRERDHLSGLGQQQL
jgi:hypothetical protein